MICPACSCETDPSRGFCDLCGEPFAKKKEGTDSPAPAKKENPVPIPPELMTKLLEAAGKKTEPPSGPVDIPPEFQHLDKGGELPTISPSARKLAWVMLAVIAAWILIAIVWMFMNQDRLAAGL